MLSGIRFKKHIDTEIEDLLYVGYYYNNTTIRESENVIAITFSLQKDWSVEPTREKIIEEFRKINWDTFIILECLHFTCDTIFLIDYVPEKIKDICLQCDRYDTREIQKLIETELHKKIKRIQIDRDKPYNSLFADEFNKSLCVFIEMLPSHIESIFVHLNTMHVDSFYRLNFHSLPVSLKRLHIRAAIEFVNMYEIEKYRDDRFLIELKDRFRKIITPTESIERIYIYVGFDKIRTRTAMIDNFYIVYANGVVKIMEIEK